VQEVPNVLMLPTHVILERERGKYVHLVTDGRMQERPSRVGAANWDFTEVAAGLRGGSRHHPWRWDEAHRWSTCARAGVSGCE
jgi:hypothetical protein